MKGAISALILFLYEALGISMTKLSIFVQRKPLYGGLYSLSTGEGSFSIWKRYTSQRVSEMYSDEPLEEDDKNILRLV